MRCRPLLLALCLAAALPLHATPPAAATATPSSLQERANHFLTLFNAGYQSLIAVREAASWEASVDVTPANDAAAEATSRSFAAFTATPPSSPRRVRCSLAGPSSTPSPFSNSNACCSTPPRDR